MVKIFETTFKNYEESLRKIFETMNLKEILKKKKKLF